MRERREKNINKLIYRSDRPAAASEKESNGHSFPFTRGRLQTPETRLFVVEFVGNARRQQEWERTQRRTWLLKGKLKKPIGITIAQYRE